MNSLRLFDGDATYGVLSDVMLLIQASSARVESASRTEGKAGPVLDVIFIAVTLAFFALSVGYVALCDRLMRKRPRPGGDGDARG